MTPLLYLPDEGIDADEWEEFKRRAVELRRLGLSYEEAAKAISGGGCVFTAGWVYKQCNPEKSSAQVVAWYKKHHPESLESKDNA
jgi:hypothetical protein